MSVHYVNEMNLNDKRVLIRVDYNVPYNDKMEITDDTRILATLPTLNHCIENKAKIILVSHLGRPKGMHVPELSLKPVAKKLSEIMSKDIQFFNGEIDEDAIAKTKALNGGDIILLENIRFHPGEEKNDDDFGKRLASLADVYINDAFATAHRGHASNEAITHHVDECGAGFLLKNEIEYFKKAMGNPERPLGAVIGGAKVSSKLAVLNNIIDKIDYIIIGGGMAFTFLMAKGISTGKSLMEEDLVDSAKEILENAEKKGKDILLPIDVVIAAEFSNETEFSVVAVDKIPDQMMGLDIGPETIKLFSQKISESKTVIWNGPMGAFEMPNFSNGTNSLAEVIADTDCLSIVGGGDSVTAVNQAGISDRISYISTGGGAFLELMEGKTLPAIRALDND